MAAIDRLAEAAYRSPSGIRQEFKYQDVSRTIEKKTAAYSFPTADGTLVQDLGVKGRRYPLRIYFIGDDSDIDSDAFESLLTERGVGVLEHPRYGEINVVPFGEITQRDDLVKSVNQSVIEVTFFATIGVAYPASQTDGATETAKAVGVSQDNLSAEFESDVSLGNFLEESALITEWNGLIDSVDDALGDVADFQDDIAKEFKTINDSITRSIDVLIGTPYTLAYQTMNMIGAPARSAALAEDRLESYGVLSEDVAAGDPETLYSEGAEYEIILPTKDNLAKNQLATKKVFMQGAVLGSITTALNGNFKNQVQAVMAAESIINQMEITTNYLDDNYRSLFVFQEGVIPAVDTGDSYQSMIKAVSIASGYLLELSQTLRITRNITLDRSRSMYDVVAEHYPNIDDYLDEFITSNNLGGSELIELEKGRKLVVYE